MITASLFSSTYPKPILFCIPVYIPSFEQSPHPSQGRTSLWRFIDFLLCTLLSHSHDIGNELADFTREDGWQGLTRSLRVALQTSPHLCGALPISGVWPQAFHWASLDFQVRNSITYFLSSPLAYLGYSRLTLFAPHRFKSLRCRWL